MTENEKILPIPLITRDSDRFARLQKRLGNGYVLEMEPEIADSGEEEKLKQKLLERQPRLMIVDADCQPEIVETCRGIFESCLFVSGVRPGVLVLCQDDGLRASIPDDGFWLWTDEEGLSERVELMLAVQRIRYGDDPGESQNVMRTIHNIRLKSQNRIPDLLRKKKRIR